MTQEDEEFLKSAKESGEKYGYPECCIKAFLSQPPSHFKNNVANAKDRLRFSMSYVDEKYTGFIPCYAHAYLIRRKLVTLESLITGKQEVPEKFPNDWTLK
jgi:hypothetical protein